MSSEALSHFIAIVLEHVNALLRNTISFGCFSVNFFDPFQCIENECSSATKVNVIVVSGFCILYLNFSGRSMHARLEFVPTIQSPLMVNSLSFVISIVFLCNESIFL